MGQHSQELLFWGKKHVLIRKCHFSRERREKKNQPGSAKSLAGVESDSSHRAVQMSEEILGSERCWLPSGSLDPFKMELLRRAA